ncbi:SPOR domain-containing protein [Amphritea sp.]|uniref:SPOR domain-containing protein n=1 Tax=Amphritea sp. TaxID=1872502 RepID=UPI003A8E960C
MAELEGNRDGDLADAFAESHKDFFYEPSSRLQMLEKLEHLSRFSDFLLLVTGPSGSGKTTLVRRLQAAPSDRTLRLCAVDGRQTPGLNGLLISLSEQLSPELDIQADNQAMLNAIYSFAQVMAVEHIQWVIIIDNADELEKAAIQLLLQMLSEAQGLPIKPHLLMAAGENFQAQLQGYDEYELLDAQVHQLMLEPFTFTEARTYLLQRYSAASSLSEKELQAVYDGAEGYPGGLNQQVEQQLRGGRIKKTAQPTGLTRVHFVSIAAVLLVVLLGSLWQYWPESDEGTTRTQVEIQLPVEAGPVIASTELPPVSPIEAESVQGSVESLSDDAIVTAPQTNLTPGIPPSDAALVKVQPVAPINLPASSEVVVEAEPSAAIAALSSTQPIESPRVQPQVKTQVKPLVQPVVKPEPAPVRPAVAAEPSKPVVAAKAAVVAAPKAAKVVPAPKPSAPVVAASSLTEAEQTLMGWPASGYTLQMLGAGLKSSAEQFIRAQAEPQKFYMFQTRYKNKPWFVVVYGQFKDRNTAHAAAATLPSALAKLKPWARTIQGIQADIATRK